jgi:adenylate kinase
MLFELKIMANKNIVLFGAPGSGKGTLSTQIITFNPIIHISTGDLLRENVANSTPIGKRAKEFMDTGKLVPDDVVIEMVKNRISQPDVVKNGFMLDGFPRTLEQAKSLDKIAKLDKVVVIEIDHDLLKKRILGRLSCPKCGRTYNINNPQYTPKVTGKCDDCKVDLTRRKDDNEETFEKRWKTYLEQSVDVIKYYSQKKNLVVHVEGVKIGVYTNEEVKKLLKI